jgi:dTDP-L-rhamnose 4-epimerase
MEGTKMKILVTGGAGFIGTHLCRRLLAEGCEVRVLDNFSEQIHGSTNNLAEDLTNIELIVGDVRNKDIIARSIEGVDVIVHYAAETGTGQSMYEISRYEEVNVMGTLNLIEFLLQNKTNVNKIVVASSRSTYGEGAYKCSEHGSIFPTDRLDKDMLECNFNPRCPLCDKFVEAIPTKETTPFNPLSYYALTKQVQEQMILMYAKVLGISAFALRYQNVYGPGQSLLNPYMGIIAIFSTLARNNEEIRIFEDGQESRDFVFIDDVVEATWRCIDPALTGNASYNVGSGISTSVIEVASEIVSYFKSESNIITTGEFRTGDIRHNFADLSKINNELGYVSKWTFQPGLKSFLDWTSQQPLNNIGFSESLDELTNKGLLKKPIKNNS